MELHLTVVRDHDPLRTAAAAYLHERAVTTPNNFPTALPRVEAVRGALARREGPEALRRLGRD